MSKITNDGLTRSSTQCFIAVHTWQQWASKGETYNRHRWWPVATLSYSCIRNTHS